MSSIEELRKNRVKWFDVPGRMRDAAEWGVRFVCKAHPGAALRRDRPRWIHFYAGPPALESRGYCFLSEPDTVWVNATLSSRRDFAETCEVAAHEAQHGIALMRDEDVPSLVGKLAAAEWLGERKIFVYHGRCAVDWLPEGSLAERNVVLLELDGDGAFTSVNHGTPRRPHWVRSVVPL